jgi:hypothetical protein
MFHSHEQQGSAPQKDVVPVYHFHTLENPFCAVPWCACHTSQQEIAKLLEQISEGVLTLREAADYADGQLVY